ncbi:MAG: hypothetical protein U0Z70_15670 [Thermomicrobiales bacterium]
MDPFSWLDAVFSGGGSEGSSTQGSAPVNQGFSPMAGWMVSQAFAGTGPVGQYLGMLYSSPGTGIPEVDWGTDSAGDVDRGDYLDFTGGYANPSRSSSTRRGDTYDSTASQGAEYRTLEVLDRGDSVPAPVRAPIDEVFVFGTPPEQPTSGDWFERYLSSQRPNTSSGQENQIRRVTPPPPRPPRPRRPTVRKPLPGDATGLAPEQPRPELDQVDSGPYFNVDVTPLTVPGSDLVTMPWMSDASAPEQMLRWGAWERPEYAPSPRWERGDAGRIETIPTVPSERSFWNRGGTGLAVGAMSLAGGIAVLMWWNPVGWAAGATALAIAAGVAATSASAVELGASYAGATTPEQDAAMNRAVSATLGYSSIGGVLGGVTGTVFADDPQAGFEEGAFWGGLAEGAAGLATSLPGLLRAIPGLWHAALPWGKSLLLTPFWFALSTGGGKGSARSLARLFAAQRRAASQIRRVQYLGTTPLLEREADWARYQVNATGTRNEAVFRITYANGNQKIVLADRYNRGSRSILEAKYGNMGQMWDPTRELHIVGQAHTYLGITRLLGGDVGYLVSSERGAQLLTQRFAQEFPAEIGAGQLWIDWVPWRR